MEERNDDVLVHYGVLGMHWGIRKQERSSGGSGRSSNKKQITKKVSNKKATTKRAGKIAAKGATLTASLLAQLQAANIAMSASAATASAIAGGKAFVAASSVAFPQAWILAGLGAAGFYAAGKIKTKKKKTD